MKGVFILEDKEGVVEYINARNITRVSLKGDFLRFDTTSSTLSCVGLDALSCITYKFDEGGEIDEAVFSWVYEINRRSKKCKN